ncbi:GNAT family N-acetyltransferase [Glutamicibacter sp. 287]|uniref:GNAT family N-acetyltransferase n=1 Tax=Micrococcaceae TaxID=1268 RepID=UPI0011428669|nr:MULTISPECIES: GNAT family N-acetyltransferase [Micrococcaceae]
MRPTLRYALSSTAPAGAARTEMATLYPEIDDRWNQKIDRARCVVSVRDSGVLVAAGVVHDAVLAPTSAMGALELGCMAVRPEYRRQGIRQQVTDLRLEYVVQAGCIPITVIDSANPSSWAAYERSERWERERTFESDGRTKYIYRATALASDWLSPPPQRDIASSTLAGHSVRPLPSSWHSPQVHTTR